MSITALEAEALKLTPEGQARLLNKLATALDSEEDSALTNEELERRSNAFQAGEDKGISSEEMHADARRRYKLG